MTITDQPLEKKVALIKKIYLLFYVGVKFSMSKTLLKENEVNYKVKKKQNITMWVSKINCFF